MPTLYSQSQADIDHLKLQSSSTLGSGRSYTHAHRIALEEDQDVRRAVGKRKRLAPQGVGDEESEGDIGGPSQKVKMAQFKEEVATCSDEWKGIDTERSDAETQEAEGPHTSALVTAPAATALALGAALQRNPDGTFVSPRVVKRKAKTMVMVTCLTVISVPLLISAFLER